MQLTHHVFPWISQLVPWLQYPAAPQLLVDQLTSLVVASGITCFSVSLSWHTAVVWGSTVEWSILSRFPPATRVLLCKSKTQRCLRRKSTPSRNSCVSRHAISNGWCSCTPQPVSNTPVFPNRSSGSPLAATMGQSASSAGHHELWDVSPSWHLLAQATLPTLCPPAF